MKRFLIHVSTSWCGMDDTFRAMAEKSEKEPWRTGDITGINKDCPLALHIKPNTRTLKDGTTYCFMDKALGIELGLWK